MKPGWADELGNAKRRTPSSKEVRAQKCPAAPRSVPRHRQSAEDQFRDMATARGWTLRNKGWPDYLLTDGGETMMVEVKSWDDRLSKGQRELFEILESLGIKVKVWWEQKPDRLLPWRKFLRLSGFELRRESQRKRTVEGAQRPRMFSAGQVKRMVARLRRADRELGRPSE